MVFYLKLHIIPFDCNPVVLKKKKKKKEKPLNSRVEEDELLSVDVGINSPNHVNLCPPLYGLIHLLVDRTLPHV